MTDLDARVARLNDILSTVNLLSWDSRVTMPAGGAETRGHQIATLKRIARDMLLDPAMADAAEAAREAATDPVTRRGAEAVLAARDWHARLPEALLSARDEASITARLAWAEAREKGDFALFRPHLETIVAQAREMAQALGPVDHPYDALLPIYEPGETAASLTALFDRLAEGLRPILDTALGRPQPRTDFLTRGFAVEKQQAFCRQIAAELGYDFTRGRLDTTIHPFEISFTRQDVRITSRWRPDWLPMAIFGTIHETGHALYEQGVDPVHTRGAHATDMIGLYAVGGTSFGMHESQSRLLENHVGRSRAFWERHFGTLRAQFPEELADVDAETFTAGVNAVRPGFVRVEADELTYDVHILLRVRLELALLDGSLEVADLPAAWNEAMKRDLGLTVPEDGVTGCLQDVHWSSGYLGSFPTYTLGNLTAASIMARLAETDPQVGQGLDQGDTAPLRAVLADKVWRHGRSLSRAELLAQMGGDAADPQPYLDYLAAKFG